MLKPEVAQQQLAQWRIAEDDSNEEDIARYVPALLKLPKKLKRIGTNLFGYDEKGQKLRVSWMDSEDSHLIFAAREELDALAASDRTTIIAAIAPKIAPTIEAAWQNLKQAPYQAGYGRRAFRAPRHPSLSLVSRAGWLEDFVEEITKFQADVVTAPWLAQWTPYAFAWRANTVAPILAAAIDGGGKVGDEVFDILYKTVTREHDVGMMGDHVIQALFSASRPDGWELMEKTLLAAQRQEGLRQSILTNADLAHPEAFVRLMRLVLEKDLIRFSAVARSINIWLGFLWDSSSVKPLRESLSDVLTLIESPAERKKAIDNKNAETVFRGLWASCFEDAPATIPVAAKLLNHKSDEIRFVATWLLTLIATDESMKAKVSAIDDSNLQVAMTAALSAAGIHMSDDTGRVDFEATAGEGAFDRLERLFDRLPEKPTTLKPIVWPWTGRKVERSMIADVLPGTLERRSPTKLLPYISEMTSYAQCGAVSLLAEQKKWDGETRAAIFRFVGSNMESVRGAAFTAIEKHPLLDGEAELLEGYLTRKAADLRRNVFTKLLAQKDTAALASADRLLAASDGNQRLAGLEILRQLAETKRARQECQTRAETFRAARKKLTKDEETQLHGIAASDIAVATLDDGLGLMNPAGRSPVVKPKRKNVPLITPAAIECLKSLDELVHEHRETAVTVETFYGSQLQELLGASDFYGLPTLNLQKPLEPQRVAFPLIEVWESWNANRAKKTRDRDELELLRASVILSADGRFLSDNLDVWLTSTTAKASAKLVLGELNLPRLRYIRQIEKIVDCLLYLNLPAGCVNHLLDCTENSFAHVPADAMQRLEDDAKCNDLIASVMEESGDWRCSGPFQVWANALRSLLGRTQIHLSREQRERHWNLIHFCDEPFPGAARRRPSLEVIAHAVRDKFATHDDLVDNLIGPKREGRFRVTFDSLETATSRSASPREAVSNTPGFPELLDKIRDRVLEIECGRGEAPTAATGVALVIGSMYGTATLFRILAALHKERFKKTNSWRGDPNASRANVLTHLLQVTFPSESNTHDEFAKLMRQAIAEGYGSDQRALELAFLAPQWTKFVESFLNWNGFSEGLYWFVAHMDTGWHSNAAEAAAAAEGLQADPEPVNAPDDLDADLDAEASDSEKAAPPQRRLSAWERLLLERTPLTDDERREGAVDVAWFRRTWEMLGAKRWQQMAEAAKYAASSQQANKAQFLADVLLGNTKRKELIDGIEKKKLKEHVRLLGLLPLEPGAKRDADLEARYEVMQSYRKYARGLSSLTKPAAMRAAEIGAQNLARLAGFPDPLRLEWAMEAKSIQDLAKGPVSATKEGVTVTLRLDEQAKPELTITRGDKLLKSIPPQIKKKHAAIADLAERGTELRKKASRMKWSLETAMCRGDAFTGAELQQLAEHAILAPLLSRLVLIGEGIAGYPDKNGRALRDHHGKLEPVKKNEQLRLAHPHDLFARSDWADWQRECFAAERVQPFKQIFRELYPITTQEKKDGAASARFNGHQVQPRQAMALWSQRGWNTQDGVFKVFHDQSLVADVSFQYAPGTAAEVEGWTLDTIRFRQRDEYKPLPLAKVPPRVFSEVMRDIDLVVSVAHRGEVDPEASASTVEMRLALLRETAKLLGLKNVRFKETHALIDGHFAQYSVHLGSGGVHRLPGGSLCIIPVHAQHRGRLFLPFADDDPRTAEIVSKVLLLARDTEIQDPTILQQLGAPAGAYSIAAPPPVVAATDKKKAKSKDDDANSTNADTSKRRFEFQEGTSDKFWEIELDGASVVTRWGRIGSDGQSKTKSFSDAAAAKKEYDKLIGEKSGKGYRETK